MERRWIKKDVSLESSVTVVMCLPISWTGSIADWPHMPAVSTVAGIKRYDTNNPPYLAVLFAQVLL